MLLELQLPQSCLHDPWLLNNNKTKQNRNLKLWTTEHSLCYTSDTPLVPNTYRKREREREMNKHTHKVNYTELTSKKECILWAYMPTTLYLVYRDFFYYLSYSEKICTFGTGNSSEASWFFPLPSYKLPWPVSVCFYWLLKKYSKTTLDYSFHESSWKFIQKLVLGRPA